jgi:putative membrane protein
MKKLAYAICIIAGTIITGCTKPDTKPDTELNKIDMAFLLQASISNTAEIDAGTLASTKATNAEVKKYAQFMVLEHNKAQMELKNVGNRVGLAVRDTLDPAHRALKTALTNAPAGKTFDSLYINSQVVDHDLTIINFRMEQLSGLNKEVKNYANTYLPHIQMHRESADSIARAYFRR